MRPNRLLLALSIAAVAAPAAVSAHPSAPAGHGSDKAPVKHAKGPKGTNYLLHACVTADASAPTDAADGALALKVLGGNRHMRDALAGATTLDAKLDAKTFVRLVGKARAAGATGKAAGIGSATDLHAGDRVIVRFWAKRGTDAAGLPAAWRVIDRGATDACAVPATPPPADPGTGDSTPGL
jgi:hypothetical protein